MDSVAVAKKLIEGATPTTSPEYYVFLLMLGFVACWGLFWYLFWFFKNKRGGLESANAGNKESNGQNGNPPIVKSDEQLQQETIRTLQRIERNFERLESKFDAQVRDVKSDLKAEISEVKTEVAELRNAYADSVHERGNMMAIVGELKGMAEANKTRNKNIGH